MSVHLVMDTSAALSDIDLSIHFTQSFPRTQPTGMADRALLCQLPRDPALNLLPYSHSDFSLIASLPYSDLGA